MCGITGFVDYSERFSKTDLNQQSEKLKHRGPNSSGTYFEENNTFRIGFASRRLAVIDPRNGGQPFRSPCGNFTLVFNGTIYNYKELKNQLLSLGVVFTSDSDTEVLLKAYIQWPETFLRKINGVFGLVIYDKTRNKIILARDPIGVKPLLYYFNGESLVFSSELRVFLKHQHIPCLIKPDALNLYLQYGFFPGSLTLIKNIQKLRPGEKAEFNLASQKLTKETYWTLPKITITDGSDDILLKTTRLLNESVKSRMTADVPFGALLSGGYDSSLVAAIAQSASSGPIKTFSIGFDEEAYNEAPSAKKIAQYIGSDHHELYFKKEHIQDLVVNFGKIIDEPTADSGAIALLLAAKSAGPEVKMLLSGDGGDELFGGYPSYFQSLRYPSLSKFFYIPKSFRRNRYLDILSQKNSIEFFKSVKKIFNEYEAFKLTGTNSSINYADEEDDSLNQLLKFDLKNYLPEDLLWKADRCMMHFGMENRDPLLNVDLVEYAVNLPMNIKCPHNQAKFLLKKLHIHISQNPY